MLWLLAQMLTGTGLTYAVRETRDDTYIIYVYPADGVKQQYCSTFRDSATGVVVRERCAAVTNQFGDVDFWPDYHYSASDSWLEGRVQVRLPDGQLVWFTAVPRSDES